MILFKRRIGYTSILILKHKGALSIKLTHDDGRVHVEPLETSELGKLRRA